jgi:hypothetical protein
VLSDTELFNNTSEITTKEILKRYGEVARQPGRQYGSIRPEAADMPAMHEEGSPPSSARTTAPVAQRIEANQNQANAWQMESSVRHVQQNGAPSFPAGNQHTPPQFQHEFVMRGSPYHQPSGSASSFEHFNTPNRQNPWMQHYNGSNGQPGSHGPP